MVVLNPLPSTSSEPNDIRQHTHDGKQTSQESARTNERLRSNQAPVKNVQITMEGPQAQGYQKLVLLFIGLAQNSAVWITKCRVVLFFFKSHSVCVVSCSVVCILFKTLHLPYASSKKCLQPLMKVCEAGA